ncbi:class I SAM-dependent methyltransferase [Flammeovirga kamogawensis]|uniref:Methyltransferase domain-containing protein n=1 Tax=Flammeovirga kamogawensis TaxID=373891 RepID=A0ABX8GRQ3_9BACT|nr:hypothetical protein [Flammeovirga kamogawensis]MBB6461363.1 putative SAM-dependent methyltransferase [Flammeovirga kamogawensis]QWG06268.1 hypothetical protein KM029_13090 [Flammeovirga kamogawensis]TRX68098.1 hypothetical protein EO216_08110 [Flammeovirga kamogawensis]
MNTLYSKAISIYEKFKLRYRLLNQSNPKLVVGSSYIFQEGWVPSDIHALNILNEKDWNSYFRKGSINNILGEHVWEHLHPKDGLIAASNCFSYLKKGGILRIAVPDGFHQNTEYIKKVEPGGTGAGADDHKVLYNYQSLETMLQEAGFTTRKLEYFDESHQFHQNPWKEENGFIQRSFKNDKRNLDGKPNYTSLIIDGIKK